uniref:Uncharacterized protein n=1 Tax=Panagrolaimus sp. JU765 TaxID=591449 RepID=A0AC34QYQ4_9BILA
MNVKKYLSWIAVAMEIVVFCYAKDSYVVDDSQQILIENNGKQFYLIQNRSNEIVLLPKAGNSQIFVKARIYDKTLFLELSTISGKHYLLIYAIDSKKHRVFQIDGSYFSDKKVVDFVITSLTVEYAVIDVHDPFANKMYKPFVTYNTFGFQKITLKVDQDSKMLKLMSNGQQIQNSTLALFDDLVIPQSNENANILFSPLFWIVLTMLVMVLSLVFWTVRRPRLWHQSDKQTNPGNNYSSQTTVLVESCLTKTVEKT